MCIISKNDVESLDKRVPLYMTHCKPMRIDEINQGVLWRNPREDVLLLYLLIRYKYKWEVIFASARFPFVILFPIFEDLSWFDTIHFLNSRFEDPNLVLVADLLILLIQSILHLN